MLYVWVWGSRSGPHPSGRGHERHGRHIYIYIYICTLRRDDGKKKKEKKTEHFCSRSAYRVLYGLDTTEWRDDGTAPKNAKPHKQIITSTTTSHTQTRERFNSIYTRYLNEIWVFTLILIIQHQQTSTSTQHTVQHQHQHNINTTLTQHNTHKKSKCKSVDFGARSRTTQNI
jgi:hypothetical protein